MRFDKQHYKNTKTYLNAIAIYNSNNAVFIQCCKIFPLENF